MDTDVTVPVIQKSPGHVAICGRHMKMQCPVTLRWKTEAVGTQAPHF